jgi:hypothetical protein
MAPNLPLEGRSKFEAASRSDKARGFREGVRHQIIAHPLPKFSPLRSKNFDLPSRGRLGDGAPFDEKR